jgi:hypothetical protein
MAGTAGIMGLDVAVFRYGEFAERPTTWSGVDSITTGDRAAKDYIARMAYRTNVDGTGFSAGVAHHMQRLGCTANRVMVASGLTEKIEMGEFKLLRDQLSWEAG